MSSSRLRTDLPRLFSKFIKMKPSGILSSLALLTFLSSATAEEIKLQPTLITHKGSYPIDTTLSYQYEQSNPLRLEPIPNVIAPILNLEDLTEPFHAGNAPRFTFKAIGNQANTDNNDEKLVHSFEGAYFAAAPNGELFRSDAPTFNTDSIDSQFPTHFPIPTTPHRFEDEELENWKWYPFLTEALQLALEARKETNHPFGAVLVHDGKTLLKAKNSVVTGQDFTAHAELNLESLAGKLSKEIRLESILVTSTEPCAMCASGSYWTGIRTIVYGLSAPGLGEITGGGSFVFPSAELLSHAKHPTKIIGPLYQAIASMVHQGFWKK